MSNSLTSICKYLYDVCAFRRTAMSLRFPYELKSAPISGSPRTSGFHSPNPCFHAQRHHLCVSFSYSCSYPSVPYKYVLCLLLRCCDPMGFTPPGSQSPTRVWASCSATPHYSISLSLILIDSSIVGFFNTTVVLICAFRGIANVPVSLPNSIGIGFRACSSGTKVRKTRNVDLD